MSILAAMVMLLNATGLGEALVDRSIAQRTASGEAIDIRPGPF